MLPPDVGSAAQGAVRGSNPTATTPVLIPYGPRTLSLWPRAVRASRTAAGTRFSISSAPGSLSWLSNELCGCSELIRAPRSRLEVLSEHDHLQQKRSGSADPGCSPPGVLIARNGFSDP